MHPMQTLFDQAVHLEILNRIDRLSASSQANWGIMSVGQMINHCQMPLLVACGKMELTDDIGFFKRMTFKIYKLMMYNDRPWTKNLSTPTDFKITEQPDFDTERPKLCLIITEFHHKALNIRWPRHPYFGEFSTEQWGKLQYKHLDHHLRQFGV